MMKKIIFGQNASEVHFDDVDKSTLIFAIKGDKIQGVLVSTHKGWIIKTGGIWSSKGFSSTREKALDASKKYFDYYAIDVEL